MNLPTLADGETWMTPDERTRNHEFVNTAAELLRNRGVLENPLLTLRVNDVAVSWLVSRRLEESLTLAPEDEAPEAPRTTSAQAEAIGKCRERLRKSIKDLEDYCARAGTPIDTGLADTMKPVIQQVQGGKPFLETG